MTTDLRSNIVTLMFNERCVMIGDHFDIEREGFNLRVRLVHDDVTDPRDRDEFDARQIKNWEKGEWFFAGLVVSVYKAGVLLDSYAVARWGQPANVPGKLNSHLNEVAMDMLDEAVEQGRDVLSRLFN